MAPPSRLPRLKISLVDCLMTFAGKRRSAEEIGLPEKGNGKRKKSGACVVGYWHLRVGRKQQRALWLMTNRRAKHH
ncbi:hypothetical protein J6590_066197 [Homalodisca vitripennis]|nr:hypothetical protein J6590_066197 [Homalodisca vitripennis]